MYIPARVSQRFQGVNKFKKILQKAKDRDLNESDTVAIVLDILSEVFGYDKYSEVTSEFAIRGTFCDLAIKIDDAVQFFIEVKAIGTSLKEPHLRQVVGYGATHGTPWIILTNGIEWQIYRIKFEQPVVSDLVCRFDLMQIQLRDDNDKTKLFLLSKEGLTKKARDEFYDRVQNVNRYVIGQLVLSDPVVNVVRRELRKFADGVKISSEEIKAMLQSQIIKRELTEGDEAENASRRIAKFYKKIQKVKKSKKSTNEITSTKANADVGSITPPAAN